MKKQLSIFAVLMAFAISIVPGLASAGDHASVANSLVGVQGYDLVSYQLGAPKKGEGSIATEYNSVTYLFANEANKKAFEASPAKYLPAYGGFCAYGVSVGKKFVGDPQVWKIVDGKLYLNLNKKVQGIWEGELTENIYKANKQWPAIKNIEASAL